MKYLKRILLTSIIIVLTAVIIVHILASLLSFNDEDRRKFFSAHHMNPHIMESTISGATIYNINSENVSDTAILFLHGAPGSWDNWKTFLVDSSLLELGQLIAIDRPGYGKSSITEMQTSISSQAESIGALMVNKGIKNLTVVGHSYGAPIAAQLGILNPQMVKQIIMVAPLIDPQSEPIFWFSYFGKWASTRWLLPEMLRIAADEKFSHRAELEILKSQWSLLHCPILHIHGLEDGLAPPMENISFSESYIPKEHLSLEVLPEEGHLTIFENPEIIINIISSFIKKNRSPSYDSDL